MKQALEFVAVGGTEYEAVAASQTNQVLGTAGSVNDLIARLVVDVGTAATSTVSIKDGANTAIEVVPANTPIGPYVIELGIRSTNGAWQITTGAGVSVIAIGQFSI
jgi:hypothetical protein